MTEVYLALGSNVGDSRGQIAQAVKLLGDEFSDIKQAPVYASKAIGYTDQPDFLNTAIDGYTGLSPQELIKFITAIEQQIGRTASFRWGPREIDIDIIFYGNLVLKTAGLTIPHPNFCDRDFVLKPLCDLNPNLADPLSKQSIKQLLDQLKTSNQSIIKELT